MIKASKAIFSKLGKKGAGTIGLGTGINLAAGGFSAVSTYSDEKKTGAGTGTAIAKGVVDGFMVDLIGFKAAILLSAGKTLPSAMVKGYESIQRKGRDISRSNNAPFSANTFMESEQTYTMRQAGMNMISNSSMSAKKAMLGNEAQMFHR